jgi:pSer/pThr/pTyr-binding forkhead associated (FHA) protein
MGRAVAIVIMGLLIGLGIGLLEQAAKQAWLKVVRGEFEGKEYLVFAGTTSIGNNGKNTIVLFKDKLVGPNHCDIVLEGSRYVLVDKGTPMGTTVNGMRVDRHTLRKGDAIAVGNSVLVYNTR